MSFGVPCQGGVLRLWGSLGFSYSRIIKTRHCISGCVRSVLSGLGRSSHVIPAWACVMVGIYGCGLLGQIQFLIQRESLCGK